MVEVINPIFFDHFGFVIWLVLIWIALKDLKNPMLDSWSRYVLLGIGIVGIILDGTLLALFYFGNKVAYAGRFDFLGIPVFLFIIWLSLKDLKNNFITRSRWSKKLMVVVGFGGLLADGFILVQNYLVPFFIG
ncbi:MAG: hypothetical protein ACE5ES_00440 [Candidatus Nanoarchaeia archaeon]